MAMCTGGERQRTDAEREREFHQRLHAKHKNFDAKLDRVRSLLNNHASEQLGSLLLDGFDTFDDVYFDAILVELDDQLVVSRSSEYAEAAKEALVRLHNSYIIKYFNTYCKNRFGYSIFTTDETQPQHISDRLGVHVVIKAAICDGGFDDIEALQDWANYQFHLETYPSHDFYRLLGLSLLLEDDLPESFTDLIVAKMQENDLEGFIPQHFNEKTPPYEYLLRAFDLASSTD